MLQNHEAIATIAVKDLNAANKFYGETLGLKKVDKDGEEATTFQAGNSKLFVYRSQFAGTNKATAVSWPVGNEIEEVVRSLKSKGVTFEHYDMPGMKREGDIHVADEMKAAWFKDPDGNILGLVSGKP